MVADPRCSQQKAQLDREGTTLGVVARSRAETQQAMRAGEYGD